MRYKTRSNRNIVYICTYHVVWRTKYRRSVLSPEIGERLTEIMRGAVDEGGGELHAIETQPDHVHVVVGCDPSFGITKLVRLMKGRTSRLLRQEYHTLRTRVPTLWTKATFIATTGGASIDVYELRATYVLDEVPVLPAGETAGIDLGEIHLAVAYDGTQTTILNGRHVRSKRRYQNTLKGKLAAVLDRKKRGSRRWTRLVLSKKRQLRALDRQLKDAAHKQTSTLVSTLRNANVQTVVIGDIRDIRKRTDCGHTANQRLHQMPSGLVRHLLTYKAQRLGMQVVLVDERYTTRTCPVSGHRYKPKGRMYRCRHCGFVFHRDGVGAINIRQKYLGSGPVVGAMASPTGVRYQPHLRRSAALHGSDRERIPAL